MSSRTGKFVRWCKRGVFLGLVVWAVVAASTIRQARHGGALLGDTLATAWPDEAPPRAGTRQQLAIAARKMEDGAFSSVTTDLGPVESLSPEQEAAAMRFLADRKVLRERLLETTAQAKRLGEDVDVALLREALARALAAAARGDESTLLEQLDLAEQVLDEAVLGGPSGSVGGRAAVVERLHQIDSAFRLGRDLLTEGHTAVEKILAKASWYFQKGEYPKAGFLVGLAAELAGANLQGGKPPGAEEPPDWFEPIAQAPLSTADEAEARAAVELCEAMARSETPSKPVKTAIQRARIELDGGRLAEAAWWTSVARAALGIAEAEAADAPPSESPEQESAEEGPSNHAPREQEPAKQDTVEPETLQ